jgi:hypothetical protein
MRNRAEAFNRPAARGQRLGGRPRCMAFSAHILGAVAGKCCCVSRAFGGSAPLCTSHARDEPRGETRSPHAWRAVVSEAKASRVKRLNPTGMLDAMAISFGRPPADSPIDKALAALRSWQQSETANDRR